MNSNFHLSIYLCHLCLFIMIFPPPSKDHSFSPVKRDKKRLWMLHIFLPNSQIFCKSKWHILKNIYAECQESVYVCVFLIIFFPLLFLFIGFKLEKKPFFSASGHSKHSHLCSCRVKSFGSRRWIIWAEYLVWQNQYDSNNHLSLSVFKGNLSYKSVF